MSILWSLESSSAQSPKMAKADTCVETLKGNDLRHFANTPAYPTSLIQVQPEVGE